VSAIGGSDGCVEDYGDLDMKGWSRCYYHQRTIVDISQQHISSSVRSSGSSFLSGISHGVLFGLGIRPVTTGIADPEKTANGVYFPLLNRAREVFFRATFFQLDVKQYYMIYPNFRSNVNVTKTLQLIACSSCYCVCLSPSPNQAKHSPHIPKTPTPKS
jgi:hypothetical protein